MVAVFLSVAASLACRADTRLTKRAPSLQLAVSFMLECGHRSGGTPGHDKEIGP